MRERDLLQTSREALPRTVGETFAQVAEGLGFYTQLDLSLPWPSPVIGLTATFGMRFNVLIPPLASQVLGTDAAGYGLLMTGLGIGALASAVAMMIRGPLAPSQVVGGAALLGGQPFALALSSLYVLSLFLMALDWYRVCPYGDDQPHLIDPARRAAMGMRGRIGEPFHHGVLRHPFCWAASWMGGPFASLTSVTIARAVGGTVSLLTGMVGLVWWSRNHPSLVS